MIHALALFLSGLALAQSPAPTPTPAPMLTPNPNRPLVETFSAVTANGGKVKLIKTPQGIFVVEEPPPPPPSASKPEKGTEEAQALEAAQAADKYRQAMQALNTSNPMSEEYGKVDSTLDPSSPEAKRAAEMRRLIDNPLLKRYLAVFQNPKILAAFNSILEHPRKMWLLYGELGSLVVLLIFRAWKKSKTTGWIKRIWIDFYSLVIFLVLVFGIIPFAILGEPYIRVASGLVTVLKTEPQKQ